MRQLRYLHHVLSRWPRASAALGFLVVAAAVCAVNLVGAGPLPPDPVEELRLALKQDKDAGKTKAGEDFRRALLDKRIAALRSPGDMSQALLLSEWRDASLLEPEVGRIDVQAREKLANLFKDAIRKNLTKGDATARAAAAGLVGDTATLARDRGILSAVLPAALGDLALDLVKTTNDPDLRVRVQAVRSLGKIQADPTKIVPALEALQAKQPLAIRRSVAEALGNLIRILSQVAKKPQTSSGTFAVQQVTHAERIQMAKAIVPAAARSLADADADVRRVAADTLWQAALELSELISVPKTPDYPPEGRPLTEDERKAIEADKESVLAERKELMPLLTALGDQGGALGAAIGDKEAAVRVLALHALEEMGNARLRLLHRAASVPELRQLKEGEKKEGDDKKEGAATDPTGRNDNIRFAASAQERSLPPFALPKGEDPLLAGLTVALPAMAKALQDPKAEVRLAAVDALEMLGDEAAGEAERLSLALADPDRFVRWAAARTLGRMNPAKINAGKVVEHLSGMLSDPDLDLRLIAAQSLERYGPAASKAVPALGHSAVNGDAEIRRAAIRALVGVGTASVPAVPKIGEALGHPDVRVRRAAAEALGRFGESAKPAEDALRKTLDDPDAEVRRLAADALLKIQ